jgi:hypothetical protein
MRKQNGEYDCAVNYCCEQDRITRFLGDLQVNTGKCGDEIEDKAQNCSDKSF